MYAPRHCAALPSGFCFSGLGQQLPTKVGHTRPEWKLRCETENAVSNDTGSANILPTPAGTDVADALETAATIHRYLSIVTAEQ